ncbi:hypothetical protein BCR42DRAFT_472239, partial [Absidia repens]
ISSQLWIQFWKIRLSPTARNVWYRLLLNKWPALTRLHYFIPNDSPLLAAPIVLQLPNHQTPRSRMLSQLSVWKSLWHLYFPALDFSPDSIWYSLLFLRPSPSPHFVNNTQWLQLLGSTLHSIWRSHWAYTFERIPVRTSTMLSTVSSSFQALQPPHTSSVAPCWFRW